MLVCLVAFYRHSTDKDTKKLPFHEILAMFLLLAGGKSFSRKERKERRVFIILPYSTLALKESQTSLRQEFMQQSPVLFLLFRKIALPLP